MNGKYLVMTVGGPKLVSLSMNMNYCVALGLV